MKFRGDLYKSAQEQVITTFFMEVYNQSFEVAQHSAKSLISSLKSEDLHFCFGASDNEEDEKLKKFYATDITITIGDGLDLLYITNPIEARRRLKETLYGYFDRDGNPILDRK